MNLNIERDSIYSLFGKEVTGVLEMINQELKGEECIKASERLNEMFSSYKELQSEWIMCNKAFNRVSAEIDKNPNIVNTDQLHEVDVDGLEPKDVLKLKTLIPDEILKHIKLTHDKK